jgi:predicted alpha/beta-hydrolase family hydrolase
VLGAVLAPGYGGSAEQPILRAVAGRLKEVGIVTRRISFSRKRPSGDYAPEIEDVRRARDALLAEGLQRVAFVGRSFGGRMCTLLAADNPPTALVLLGHPIAPPGRPRPQDEAALAAVRCPTLIVQGARDALGPLDVLRRIAASNSCIELHVLDDVGHQFGPRQAEAVARAAAWLARLVPVPEVG